MANLIDRRALIGGVVGLIAAPAIVRASNIMRVKTVDWEFADPVISLDGMEHDGWFWRDSAGRKFSVDPVGRFFIKIRNGEIVEQNYQPGGDVYEHAPGLGSIGFERVGRLSDDDYQKDVDELRARVASYGRS